MADIRETPGEDQIDAVPMHPLLAHLNEQEIANVASLKGYVGPSPKNGYIRLYADLDNLADSADILRSDVLFFSEAPESVLPLNGMVLWIKKDAQVVVNKVETTKVTTKVDADGVEISRGRLKIFVRGGLRSSVCQSRCNVCQSRCNVCQSRCKAAFDNGSPTFPMKK